MKRMLITAVASSALALGAPAVASAHHHHKRHHAKHLARHARVLTFKGAGSSTSQPSPTSPASTPAGEPAGTVTSFTSGVLMITLTDGTVVSGKVTEQTELACRSSTADMGDDQGARDDQGGGDDQGGRESGEHGGPVDMARESDSHATDGQDDDEGAGNESCTSAALVPGAKVGEAELRVSSAGAVWEKVELVQ
jgi:hypothetical protein